ncbi:MAG: RNaseH domain-containing protein [Pseudomonas sp.]
MKVLELRTSLFEFDANALGHAYRAVVGPQYLDAWQALQGLAKKPHPGLPTTGLEEMLAVLSGGPVRVELFPQKQGGVTAIVMLNTLPIDVINEALRLWSMDVLRIWQQELPGLKEALIITDVTPLDTNRLVAPADVSGLAYDVIPWLVCRALVRKPMQASKPICLYQTSDSSVIAWDDPIISENDVRYASALHVIEPKLVLLHSQSRPYIQLRVKLSQVMPSLIGKKKHAWVKTGNLIVKARIKTRPIEGGWSTTYEHPVQSLLAYMNIPSFPPIVDGGIPTDSEVRPIYAIPPSNPLIGSGPGPLFLDQAGFHLTDVLPGTRPLKVRKAVGALRAEKVISSGEVVNLNVMVLAAHADVMLRLQAASATLAKDSKFFKKVMPPLVTLARLDVPDTQRMLDGHHDANSLSDWLLTHVVRASKVADATGTKVMIVETSASAASKDAGLDPKHVIRRVLAKHGIATQFIMHIDPDGQPKRKKKAKEDDRDFKATNSIIEAIRLSGKHPAPTPRTKSMSTSTTVLSILVDRIQDKGWATLLPVITRTALGGHEPEIFWFDSGIDTPGRWLSYTEGLTAIHSTDTLLKPDQLKTLITQSLLDCKIQNTHALVVCLDAELRTFYGGLKDSPGEGWPPIPNDAAIVRIRADHQVAQMSGNHTFSPLTANYIGPKVGAFQSCVSASVYYFVSPSKLFGSVRSQRENTRYDVSERDLRDPWQQLGVTEIAISQIGSFASATVIAEQVALLCRNPPFWDGHLRLPGPMHLGKQVAADHPILEMRRKSDANRRER